MSLVIIFGPQAVGKMTVGEELEKLTKLKLFHNHMTIELVSKFHSYGTKEGKRLVRLFRDEIMLSVANSDLDGMIFTYVWRFEFSSDWEYIEHIRNIFREHNIYFVELVANLETRIKRNVSENRLSKKPTKRNIEWSNNDLIQTDEKYRLVSVPGEIKYDNYLRIDNTKLSTYDVAKRIQQTFNL
ncbi:AAA family ATPase [Mycoplasmatota bacterium zrk1]